MEGVSTRVLDYLSLLVDEVMKVRCTEGVDGTRKSYSPFFVLLEAVDKKEIEVYAQDGETTAICEGPKLSPLSVRTELRIGGYEACGHSLGSFSIPKSLDPYSIKREALNYFNSEVWNAIRDFEERYAKSAGIIDPARIGMIKFSREEPIIMKINGDQDPFSHMKIDKDQWEQDVREISRHLMNKKVHKSEVEFFASQIRRYLVTSEGTRIMSSYTRYSLNMEVVVCDSKNRILELNNTFHRTKVSEMPSLDEIILSAEDLVKSALDLKKCPVQEPGVYPTIMDPANHGVLWHEAIGHSLEGHRIVEDDKDDDWFFSSSKAEAFKGQIGKKVTADFITVWDDPTIKGLDGSYTYDQEGVRAQKVLLIKNGILKNYLLSRETAGRLGTHSNGHSRNSNHKEPTPRMSNIVVKSANHFPYDTLKEMLIKECRRQKKPYGLIFSEFIGGLAAVKESFFNVFPRDIFRVYTDGSVERVRGVYQVGTPYTILSNITATGGDYGVSRGTCGAESGSVPETSTAPHALFRQVEIARIPSAAYSILPRRVLPVPDPKEFG